MTLSNLLDNAEQILGPEQTKEHYNEIAKTLLNNYNKTPGLLMELQLISISEDAIYAWLTSGNKKIEDLALDLLQCYAHNHKVTISYPFINKCIDSNPFQNGFNVKELQNKSTEEKDVLIRENLNYRKYDRLISILMQFCVERKTPVSILIRAQKIGGTVTSLYTMKACKNQFNAIRPIKFGLHNKKQIIREEALLACHGNQRTLGIVAFALEEHGSSYLGSMNNIADYLLSFSEIPLDKAIRFLKIGNKKIYETIQQLYQHPLDYDDLIGLCSTDNIYIRMFAIHNIMSLQSEENKKDVTEKVISSLDNFKIRHKDEEFLQYAELFHTIYGHNNQYGIVPIEDVKEWQKSKNDVRRLAAIISCEYRAETPEKILQKGFKDKNRYVQTHAYLVCRSINLSNESINKLSRRHRKPF